jgi:hypothetical protein
MLNHHQTRLEIFDSFRIDYTLPKHKRENSITVNSVNGVSVTSDGTSFIFSNNSQEKVSRLKKVGLFFKGLFKSKKVVSVEEFFKSVKSNSINIDLIDERIKGYTNLLVRAKQSGQVALFEELTDNIEVVKLESILLAAGFEKAVSEKTIIEFYKKSKEGLRLDWVKNFKRIIPCEIIENKTRLDELKIFDNYVVLHYDPAGSAYGKTKEEEKDPILFGVIKGSDKLYFVGDWVDEVCDLTLEELGKVVGQDKLDEASLKVNVYGNIKK